MKRDNAQITFRLASFPFYALIFFFFLVTLLSSESQRAAQAWAEDKTGNGLELTLIDANTGAPIRKLKDGDTVEISKRIGKQIAIRADTPADVKSVQFSLDRIEHYRRETARPFLLAGDSHGRPNALELKPGKHTLKVAAKTADHPVSPLKLSFTVTEGSNKSSSESESRAALTRELLEPMPPPKKAAKNEKKNAPPDAQEAPEKTEPAQNEPEQARKRNVVFSLGKGSAAGQIGSDDGRCVSFLDQAEKKMTVACTHSLPQASSAIIERSTAPGKALCELSPPSSPLISSCRATPAIVKDFYEGNLLVRVRGVDGTQLMGNIRQP